MRQIQWNPLKSKRLKRTRGVSFEEVIKSRLIAIRDNPSRPEQKILLFDYRNYVWAVPYVKDGDIVFLKTLYPSRKYTKIYKPES